MASVAVASTGRDRIVEKGSRNAEFFYTVNGIRRGYDSFRSIGQDDKDYLRDSVNARMPSGFSPEIRSMLISNGTFRPDGTVSMETAHRLGRDRIWQERDQPRPQADPSAP